jgi:hypothetical protein
MHSIDGIPMEDASTIPDELAISEQSMGYLDRVIKLNTEAMGDRDEWDVHGNAILDLVREMAGEMDALRDIIKRRLACDGSNGKWDAMAHFDLTEEMRAAIAKSR